MIDLFSKTRSIETHLELPPFCSELKMFDDEGGPYRYEYKGKMYLVLHDYEATKLQGIQATTAEHCLPEHRGLVLATFDGLEHHVDVISYGPFKYKERLFVYQLATEITP